jgi:hypothetical protein
VVSIRNISGCLPLPEMFGTTSASDFFVCWILGKDPSLSRKLIYNSFIHKHLITHSLKVTWCSFLDILCFECNSSEVGLSTCGVMLVF